MSQAEELLNGMAEEIPVHTHPVPDTDTHFVIDPITRQIENANPKKNVIMQHDHNSERFTFELPRYIDGHDMLECTSVTVNVDNIETGVDEPRVNSDAPDMTDLRLHPTDPEKAICSWLISRNSTQLAGILSFHIEFKCVDSAGNVVYEWSTDNYDEIEIKARKKNGEAAITPHVDTLEQWRTRIFGAGDSVMANIAAEGEAQVAAVKAESETQQEAVELKGFQTLDTIPENYTEVGAMAEEAVRTKGDAIVCEATGESITIKDSSNDHIRGLKIFGKTTQYKTTGAQLIPQPYMDGKTTINGVRFTVNSDGSVAASGTSTGSINYYFVKNMTLPIGTYTFSKTGDLIGGRLYIYDFTELAALATLDENVDYVTFTTDKEYHNIGIYINTAYEGKVFGGIIYPMLNAGSEVLPYEQYSGAKPSPNPQYPQELVSANNPKVIIAGRNLWNPTKPYDVSGTYWSWKVKHSNEKITITLIDRDPSVDLAGAHIGVTAIGGEPTSGYRWLVSKGTVHLNTYTTDYGYISIYPNDAVTLDALTRRFYIMVEHGENYTLYEAPREESAMLINRTINSIPVSENGNYTDSDGQQWICDEVDLERGVYIQRTKLKTLYDRENWYTWGADLETEGQIGFYTYCEDLAYKKCISNSFRYAFYAWGGKECGVGAYANPENSYIIVSIPTSYLEDVSTKEAAVASFIKFISQTNANVLVCINPIETPLTAEEIAAFKALRTNHPNTTILNDAGAWMSVKYNADTKSYVDNPKTLKLVDSSTGVVYELKIVDGNLTVVPV